MNIAYTQKFSTIQKIADSKAVPLFDSSSQSESLQRKSDMLNNAAQRAAPPRPNNTGMPDNLKSGIESLSGFSMDDVRVHYNSSKPATVQALAYTQGTDIHVAPGQEKHLPHEAWHVAQQMAGRVSPTTNINGMPVNDNASLEHEADVMGEKAVQCKLFGANFTNGKEQSSTVQRMAFYNPNMPAETEQKEGNKELADLFGRDVGEERPQNVARKVDQYKKEMLTYIASRIQEKGENNDCDYGPHISVVITKGIWFIAINSDYVKRNENFKKDYPTEADLDKHVIECLKNDSENVKTEIIEKWNALKTYADNNKKSFNPKIKNAEATSSPTSKMEETAANQDGKESREGKASTTSASSEKNVDSASSEAPTSKDIDEDIAQKQALYIAYRWAGKSNGVFVEQNKSQDKSKGVIHGEMQTISFLSQNISEKLRKAAILFSNTNATTAAKKASMAANTASALEAMFKEETDNVESDTDTIATVSLYYATKNAINETAEVAEKTADNVRDACAIIMHCKELINGGNDGRVVRVGGTKTACFDCGYEMNVHKVQNVTGHKHPYDPRSFKIGPRNAVTMTFNCGDGFPNWIHPKETNEKNKSSFMLKNPNLASHDSHQNQDYNELYDTFNSLKLKIRDGDTEKDVKMDLTDSMKEEWYKRYIYCANKLNKQHPIFFNNLISLNKKNSFELKDLFSQHLETLYNYEFQCHTVDSINKLAKINQKISGKDPSFSLLTKIPKNNNDLKEIITLDRLIIHRLDLNIQGEIAQSIIKVPDTNITRNMSTIKDSINTLLDVIKDLSSMCLNANVDCRSMRCSLNQLDNNLIRQFQLNNLNTAKTIALREIYQDLPKAKKNLIVPLNEAKKSLQNQLNIRYLPYLSGKRFSEKQKNGQP